MSRTHRKHAAGNKRKSDHWMYRRQTQDDMAYAELVLDRLRHADITLIAPLNEPIPGLNEEEPDGSA